MQAEQAMPGSQAERALSTEVLLNLKSAIAAQKYGKSKIMEDFYALLQTSWNIRESFIGPFKPLPGFIFERLGLYDDIEIVRDLCELLVNYLRYELEINEYVSLRMHEALPSTYDRFLVFLVFRPTSEFNQEPIVDLAEKVRNAHQSIIKPGGIYEKTKTVSHELEQVFKTTSELKNATQKTIELLFVAIDNKNEEQCRELRGLLSSQLDKLIEDTKRVMEKLRELNIKEVLSELSSVHKKLYKTALDIFHDEFRGAEGIDDESQDEFFEEYSSFADSLHVNIPSIFQQSSEPGHSRVFCTIVRLTVFILLLYAFFRFNKCCYSLCMLLFSKNWANSKNYYGKIYQKL